MSVTAANSVVYLKYIDKSFETHVIIFEFQIQEESTNFFNKWHPDNPDSQRLSSTIRQVSQRCTLWRRSAGVTTMCAVETISRRHNNVGCGDDQQASQRCALWRRSAGVSIRVSPQRCFLKALCSQPLSLGAFSPSCT